MAMTPRQYVDVLVQDLEGQELRAIPKHKQRCVSLFRCSPKDVATIQAHCARVNALGEERLFLRMLGPYATGTVIIQIMPC